MKKDVDEVVDKLMEKIDNADKKKLKKIKDEYTKERLEECALETDAYLDFVNVFRKHFPKKTRKSEYDDREYDNSDPHLIADISLARAIYWYINERYDGHDYNIFPHFLDWMFSSFVSIVMEDIIPKLIFIKDWMKEKDHKDKNQYDWNDLDNKCFYVPLMEEINEKDRFLSTETFRDAIVCQTQNYRYIVVFEYFGAKTKRLIEIHLREILPKGKKGPTNRISFWRGPYTLAYLKRKKLNVGYGDSRDQGYLLTVKPDCDDISELPSKLDRVDRPLTNIGLLSGVVFDLECLYGILKYDED